MVINGIELPKGYNGIGLHDSPGSDCGPQSREEAQAHAQELRAHGVTTYKLLSQNGSGDLHRARAYVEAGIVPVVRWYVDKPWGQGNYRWVTPGDQVRPYYDAGVRLIEPGWNEWNIACEWQNDRIPDAKAIAREAVNAWEVGLGLQSQFAGLKVLFPSNTPGGNVDHRACYKEIRAELERRGLAATVEHAAIHPRPHNNPPWVTWTATNTVTFDEWRWIRDTLAPSAYYWATEHGYSLGDDQNHDYPRIDLGKWLEYNWELFVRMNPANGDAIEGHLAGVHHWIEALWGHRVAWMKDSLRDAYVPEMPTPSPLWVRMGERAGQLAFERYGGAEPPEPPEPPAGRAEGVDVSYAQSKAVRWDELAAAGASFAYLRSSIGRTIDDRLFRHLADLEAAKADLLVGVYHYLNRAWPAADQARLLWTLDCGLVADLPPVVDVEDEGLSAAWVREFVETWKKLTARPVMVYTSASKWHRIVGDGATWAKGTLLWVAHWNVDEPELPDVWDKWEFWQYTVAQGPGYDGRLDRDRFNGTAEELWKRYGGAEPPEPPEPPPDDSVRILDRGGNLKDWNWLTAEFGLTPAEVEQGDDWRITQIQEGGPSAALLVYGPPGTVVTFGWPDGCVQGTIELKGYCGFGMGGGAYYWPPNVGPHYIRVGDAYMDGLGMIGGTEHRHVDVTVEPVP